MATVPANLDVWVLAGQSNMEGVGELHLALPQHPRVWLFTSAGQWEVAQEPLHWLWEAYTPVNRRFRRDGLAEEQRGKSDAEWAAQERAERRFGAGLGLPFGIAMADALDSPVGLIAAAHGGTSLEQWSPALKAQGGDSLYGAMLDRLARAGGRVRGVLWYQGESDAFPGVAESYAERFVAWVHALRADLGIPDLPVATVQIGRETLPNFTEWDAIRLAQETVPRLIDRVTVTSAIDLGLVDAIHINTVGLIRLGRRMARQLLALEGVGVSTGPEVVRVTGHTDSQGRSVARVVCRGVTGGWQPADNLAGFTITGPHGEPTPDNHVFTAYPDPNDPTTIIVCLNLPARPGDRLWYGRGQLTYANVTDAADMPLCAFAREFSLEN